MRSILISLCAALAVLALFATDSYFSSRKEVKTKYSEFYGQKPRIEWKQSLQMALLAFILSLIGCWIAGVNDEA